MSGGHFDYKQSAMRDIADALANDITLALRPKPEKVHEDSWTIYEQISLHSYRPFHMYCSFDTYDEAESFLLRVRSVIKADDMYRDRCFCNNDDIMFQSTESFLNGTADNLKVPVLYWIHHCEYDHYPYDENVLELQERSIEIMKEAYKHIRIAEIYTTQVDRMMSGDDSEDTLKECIERELRAFYEEFAAMEWKHIDNDE